MNASTEHDHDHALVTACRRGDVSAFEELVLRHQKMLLNVTFRILGSYEDACEVTQDAFLAAYRKLGDFRGDARFSTWLVAIGINLSRNRLKQLRSRQLREAGSLDDPEAGETLALTASLAGGRPSPLRQLEDEELRQALQRCIQKLDDGFREVLVLRDMQEFSCDEVAKTLGVRDGTVKSRLFRAREAVKNCLKRSVGLRA